MVEQGQRHAAADLESQRSALRSRALQLHTRLPGVDIRASVHAIGKVRRPTARQAVLHRHHCALGNPPRHFLAVSGGAFAGRGWRAGREGETRARRVGSEGETRKGEEEREGWRDTLSRKKQ